MKSIKKRMAGRRDSLISFGIVILAYIVIPVSYTHLDVYKRQAVTMAAIAACSAQKPMEQGVSMQTPLYTFPRSVRRAAATLPA